MDHVDILMEAIHCKGQSVLATIIQVEGHAYRKQGTMMLLKQDGRCCGSLSPGCLESDLMEYVPSILEQRTPQLIEYDMRPEDDLSWGENIGCGGLIQIVLEPVANELYETLVEVMVLLEAGQYVQLVRSFQHSYMSIQYRIENGRGVSSVGNQGHEYAVSIDPKPRLVIFGAGDDAIPVVELAQKVGFRVLIADYREALCTEGRFPGANIVFGFPNTIIKYLKLLPEDYVIVMSHQYQRDYEFLQAVLPLDLTYVGVLGSVTRTTRMLGGTPLPIFLHYPVGLSIGSDGPEEIAVSIVAQLIQTRRRRIRDETAENHRSVPGGW